MYICISLKFKSSEYKQKYKQFDIIPAGALTGAGAGAGGAGASLEPQTHNVNTHWQLPFFPFFIFKHNTYKILKSKLYTLTY